MKAMTLKISQMTLLGVVNLLLIASLFFWCEKKISLIELHEQHHSKKYILQVAGVWDESKPLEEQIHQIDTKLIHLPTGTAAATHQPVSLKNHLKAFHESELLSFDDGVAQMAMTAEFGWVYIVHYMHGKRAAIVLPIQGKGVLGHMYGLIALDRKAQSIRGLLFFEHDETPLLGDSAAFSRWIGRRLVDQNGNSLPLGALKKENFSSATSLDAFSGATMTVDRIEQMIIFWLGDWGYQRYLEQLRKELINDD
jgi:Na+-transporting NADH:ubiquinone oxidoreductase subunit C